MGIEEELSLCNETELIQMARAQGLGRLRRGLPKHELVKIVYGSVPVHPSHVSGTEVTRSMLAMFIHNPEEYPPDPKYAGNWERARSQLPACNGICTKFNCSEGKHASCFAPNEAVIAYAVR